MRRRILGSAIGAAALALAGLGAVMPTASAAGAAPAAQHLHPARVCHAVLSSGEANCHAMLLVRPDGSYRRASAPPSTALTPNQLQDAYNLTGLSSGGRTVAIVDAYGYPSLEQDLATYRSQFNLPACTTANGCLTITDQNGGTSYPRADTGWDQEQALDVDAVSAACPDCHILVVQADSSSFADLGQAVVTASQHQGVVAISNSYGGSDAADSTYGTYYDHPGIAVTASTGDNGYQGGSYPADSSYVTAAGGTSLVQASGTARGWSETVWDGAGSGCSSYNAALSAAQAYDTGCSMRAMADVSAAADPNYGGLAVYYPTNRRSSTWGQIGGTSESSPIIASVYALSGNTSGSANEIPYENSSALFDVTSGSNGSCPTSQWCQARVGWDGPTGLGTPNGDGAF